MIERDVDCMKYRTHTHLASVDVNVIIEEKGVCVLTIKDAYYSKSEMKDGKKVGTNLNGKITDGYYLEFIEDVLPMCVNSGNRETLASISKQVKNIPATESRKVSNWIGLKVEMYVKDGVRLGAEIKSGIRIKAYAPPKALTIDEAKAKLNESKTLVELGSNWGSIGRDAQKLPGIEEHKNELKGKLK